MKTLKDLFTEPLHWSANLPNTLHYWYCDSYPVSICWLRMNDFPDQPFWTLYFNGECLDFDDDPENWVINYE